MRKIITIILTITIMIIVFDSTSAEEVIIPDTAIRLRVIPNSNTLFDQEMKNKVTDYLENDLYSIFSDVDNIKDARTIINNNIENIEKNINNIFIDNQYNMDFKVNYGLNYFPIKEYKGITYKEGYYESLVVEIGKAEGDNFWCVLFPSLCLLETEQNTDVEYKIGVIELINKIFNH